jgi:hypothetical protein
VVEEAAAIIGRFNKEFNLKRGDANHVTLNTPAVWTYYAGDKAGVKVGFIVFVCFCYFYLFIDLLLYRIGPGGAVCAKLPKV